MLLLGPLPLVNNRPAVFEKANWPAIDSRPKAV